MPACGCYAAPKAKLPPRMCIGRYLSMATREPVRLGQVGQVVIACALSVAAMPLVALCHSIQVWESPDEEAAVVLGILALVSASILGSLASLLTRGLARRRPVLRCALVCLGVPVLVSFIVCGFIQFLWAFYGPVPPGGGL